MGIHVRRSALGSAAGLLLIATMLPTTAFADTGLAARASLTPIRQTVDDSSGTTLDLTVRNSGSVRIGAFKVNPPNSFWTVLGCGFAPPGWTASLAADGCVFESAPGDSDDIKPGQQRKATLLSATGASANDEKGRWTVEVTADDSFNAPTLTAMATAQATDLALGLRTRAFSFQILDARIVDVPATVGDPCPEGNHSAPSGSTGLMLVLCGTNRTSSTQTLKPKFAGLKGTFIRSHGAFTSGPIAPGSESVVLGMWSNVATSTTIQDDLTVLARVRSASNVSSGWRTLTDYNSTD